MGASRGAPEGRIATVSGAVLLGAASASMGSDDAVAQLGNSATRVATLLDSLFEEVLLVGGVPPAGAPGRGVPDVAGPPCALRDLATALGAAAGERVLVVSCDLPLVAPDLLLALVAWPEADAVVPRTRARSHPLCALYRRDAVLPVALGRLAAGEVELHDLLTALDTSFLEEPDLARVDPDGEALTYVNTPAELERVRALAVRRPARLR